MDGCGEAWVGAFLNVVEVDEWGSFRFVLLRLRDRNGRHKFLVRGHNYASDAQLLGAAHKQVGRWYVPAGSEPMGSKLTACHLLLFLMPSPQYCARALQTLYAETITLCHVSFHTASVTSAPTPQMLMAAGANNVTPEALESCGGGTMEWRRDRDRHLSIHSGYVQPHSTATGAMTAMEVMNLACVLTKQHLPMHYKVTVEGGRMM